MEIIFIVTTKQICACVPNLRFVNHCQKRNQNYSPNKDFYLYNFTASRKRRLCFNKNYRLIDICVSYEVFGYNICLYNKVSGAN